jgi:tRNA dimethylallyltransferase
MGLNDVESVRESQTANVNSEFKPRRAVAGLRREGAPSLAYDFHEPMASASPRRDDPPGLHSLSAALSISAGGLVEPLKPGNPDYPLVAIVGSTASGKSSLAVQLARAFGGEVINFDSVQVYRGFDIGSGKLTIAERQGVPHHLLDVAEPHVRFTAGDFRSEALKVLKDLRGRGKLPVLVGGTGLYLRALLMGLFEGPARSEELRVRLSEVAGRRGRDFLHRMLVRKDPETAARIHPRDAQKAIRALEVCLLERRPFSELLGQGRQRIEGFRIYRIGLSPPRASLLERINARTQKMFAGGITDEVRRALESGGPDQIPLEALGYRQARAYIQGDMSREEAIRETQAQTRQYAKRQMTWFRREPGVRWFDGFGDDAALEQQVFQWFVQALASPMLEQRPAFSF